MRLFLFALATAATLAAQSFEVEPLHAGQDEVSAALAFYNASRGTPYVGVNVGIGRSLTDHFAGIGEFDVTSIDGIVLTQYKVGGRLNLAKRTRFVPYLFSTAGLLHASGFGASVNGFGFGAGVGLMYRANNHVDFKIDVREKQITTLGWWTLFHWYTMASVGMSYRFETPRDTF